MRLMTVRLLACVLLVSMPAAGVKPVVVEAGWDDLRTAIGNTDFLPTVRAFTGVDGKNQNQGKVWQNHGLRPCSHQEWQTPFDRQERTPFDSSGATQGFHTQASQRRCHCRCSNWFRCQLRIYVSDLRNREKVSGWPVESSPDCLPIGSRSRRRTLPRLSAGKKGRPWISRFRTEELKEGKERTK